MTTELHKLRPSTIAPIPAEVLRALPLGGIYLFGDVVLRVTGWSEFGHMLHAAWFAKARRWGQQLAASAAELQQWEIRYPKLPALSFKMTAGQISDRSKTVTRRRNIPKWAQPGRLFMAWDRLHRRGAGKAHGLGVFRIVSAVRQSRYACNSCHGPLHWNGDWYFCPKDPEIPVEIKVDNLTPAELAAEGFPDMSADVFWKLLEDAGNVRDGMVARIQFESA